MHAMMANGRCAQGKIPPLRFVCGAEAADISSRGAIVGVAGAIDISSRAGRGPALGSSGRSLHAASGRRAMQPARGMPIPPPLGPVRGRMFIATSRASVAPRQGRNVHGSAVMIRGSVVGGAEAVNISPLRDAIVGAAGAIDISSRAGRGPAPGSSGRSLHAASRRMAIQPARGIPIPTRLGPARGRMSIETSRDPVAPREGRNVDRNHTATPFRPFGAEMYIAARSSLYHAPSDAPSGP
jgi:hypothetical protein